MHLKDHYFTVVAIQKVGYRGPKRQFFMEACG